MEGLEDSKTQPLDRFLCGLGIPHVGKRLSGILADGFGSLERLSRATERALLEIDGVSPKVAKRVVGFFRAPENMETLKRLEDAGLSAFVDRAEIPSREEILEVMADDMARRDELPGRTLNEDSYRWGDHLVYVEGGEFHVDDWD